jgi:hypothetical protein
MTIDSASSSDQENEGTLFSESDNDGAEASLQLSDDDRKLSSPPLRDIAVSKRKKRTSLVWDHFKLNASDKTHAFCLLCSKSIYYGASRSTSMLECHVKRKHPKEHSEVMSRVARLKVEAQALDGSSSRKLTQSSLSGFVVNCPSFEACLLRWIIKTNQPLCILECEDFRDMCKALNKRSPILGSD